MPSAPTPRRAAFTALLTLVALVFVPPAVAARAKVAVTPITGAALAVSVRVSGTAGDLEARMQRRQAPRWLTVDQTRLHARKGPLRWAAAAPGTAYRIRVQVVRGSRVVATSPSLLPPPPARRSRSARPPRRRRQPLHPERRRPRQSRRPRRRRPPQRRSRIPNRSRRSPCIR